jgi:cytochrome c oxidase subunit 2
MLARLVFVAAVSAALGYVGGGVAQQGERARRIELVATKYAFSQPEIRLQKGVPVTLVLSTADFPHGFSIPDLNTRVDLIPGKPVSVTLTAQRSGRFAFLCDNFCGEGHDRMSGFLIVED